MYLVAEAMAGNAQLVRELVASTVLPLDGLHVAPPETPLELESKVDGASFAVRLLTGEILWTFRSDEMGVYRVGICIVAEVDAFDESDAQAIVRCCSLPLGGPDASYLMGSVHGVEFMVTLVEGEVLSVFTAHGEAT